jgi:hypothetical protein
MQEESAWPNRQMQSVAQDPTTSSATSMPSQRGAPLHVLHTRELEAEVEDLSMYRILCMQQTQKTINIQKAVSELKQRMESRHR